MEKRDFFISYNKADRAAANWIAQTLSANGYSVYYQEKDIAPGDNFVARMNEFLKNVRGFIPVWSKHYAESKYCMTEFQAAFNEWHKGNVERILPVCVESYPMEPLYAALVHVDAFGVDEKEKERRLLIAVNPNRRTDADTDTTPPPKSILLPVIILAAAIVLATGLWRLPDIIEAVRENSAVEDITQRTLASSDNYEEEQNPPDSEPLEVYPEVYDLDFLDWNRFDLNNSSYFRREIDDDGSEMLVIEHVVPNWARWEQEVSVKKDTDYLLSAQVKVRNFNPTEDAPGMPGIGFGPSKNSNVFCLYGDTYSEWTEYIYGINSGNFDSVKVYLIFGSNDKEKSTGTVYFKDIVFREVETGEPKPKDFEILW